MDAKHSVSPTDNGRGMAQRLSVSESMALCWPTGLAWLRASIRGLYVQFDNKRSESIDSRPTYKFDNDRLDWLSLKCLPLRPNMTAMCKGVFPRIGNKEREDGGGVYREEGREGGGGERRGERGGGEIGGKWQKETKGERGKEEREWRGREGGREGGRGE